MKLLLTTLMIATLGAFSAHGKTFKLPNEDFAIASIDMPDSWKPQEADTGVYGQSSDDAVYLSVVAVGSETLTDLQLSVMKALWAVGEGTVGDILGYLAGGMSEDQLLSDFPQLTRDDIRACLTYAAERERRTLGIPAA